MKTILVLTDFSKRAGYAAEYATHIALKNEANIILCNAMESTSELADGVELNWPIAEHLVQKKEETILRLEESGEHLKHFISRSSSFKPSIEVIAEFGTLAEVAVNIIYERAVDLVVIGSHKSSGLSRFLFGSHTHQILDRITCPVLLIPENLEFKGISSIAYATDLSFDNTKVINYLIKMAKAFNASISVNHISPLEFPAGETEKTIRLSLKEHLASYTPPVFYHSIKGYNIKNSLLEITGSGKADILALVHKRYDFFERLFHASVSKQMADSATIPLLVLPFSFSTDESVSSRQQSTNSTSGHKIP